MSKTLQGHRTKLNKTKHKNDKKRRQSVVAADNSYTVQHNHDRLIIVKRRKVLSLHQRVTDIL